jgi:hypothetical protein
MDTVNLQALNSTSFVFARTMTPWASLYNLAAGKFRAMMRITAADPVVQYEWSSDGGTITFAQSAAQGTVDYPNNPVNGDTLTLGSSQVTFVAAGSAVTLAPSSTVTITNATPAVVSWTAHGLPAGTPIVLSTTGALPAGLTAGTTYYVSSAGLTANAFELSDNFNDALAGINNFATSSAGTGVQTATAPTTVVWASNGQAAGANVAFTSSGTLPSALISGQVYFVIPTLLETNSFQIAAAINGTALTFGGPHTGSISAFVGNNVPIGLTVGNTLTNLLSLLNASVDPQIALCVYALGGDELSIVFETTSIAGNLFALAASSSGVVVSAPTLFGAGGVLTMTAPVGDIEAFQGAYVYDCRFEMGSTVVQLFGGTLTFTQGVTR